MKTHRKNDSKTQRPSQRPRASSGIRYFSEKTEKNVSEEEELGYTLSDPELAQASAKNARKFRKSVDFPCSKHKNSFFWLNNFTFTKKKWYSISAFQLSVIRSPVGKPSNEGFHFF